MPRPASERTIANPRRILFAITGLELGGAEVQLWHQCRALSARGWSVHVVSLIEPGVVGTWLRAAGIEVSALGMRRGSVAPRAVLHLARRIDAFAPGIVHSHLFHANLLARAARALWSRVPLVNSSHVDELGVAWQHRAYRATAGLCALFHCVSAGALENLARSRAAPRERLVHVPNGVPEPRPSPGARARLRAELDLGPGFVFLCAGRLHPAKHPENALDAFARLAAADPAARLLIAGSGPLEAPLRERVARLGLASAVRVLGARSDMPELLRAADALVIPSRSEALPMILLESALAELPVVATTVGDVGRVVEDGRSGLLCAPQDAAALAARMQELRHMPAERRMALAAALGARVRAEYALDAITARWEQLYAGLLAAR